MLAERASDPRRRWMALNSGARSSNGFFVMMSAIDSTVSAPELKHVDVGDGGDDAEAGSLIPPRLLIGMHTMNAPRCATAGDGGGASTVTTQRAPLPTAVKAVAGERVWGAV